MGETWHPLDLRRRASEGPKDGELVALHIIEKAGRKSNYYEVGRFKTLHGRAFFEGVHTHSYGFRLNERSHVSWLRLPEDKTGHGAQ